MPRGTTKQARPGFRSRLHAQVEAWRGSSFGPASEQPYRRRTSDRVRVVVAVLVLAWLIAGHGTPSDNEVNFFTFFNSLPDDLQSLFRGIYDFGALWAVGVIAIAALVARRWRLARDLAIAGVLAWALSRLIGALVVQEVSLGKGIDVVTRLGDDSPAFPVVRLAVIVAVIAAASPYLTRPIRRVGQVLIVVMALASMYLGAGYPDGVVAAIFLGWGVAAVVHLAFGSPGGRPTSAQVAAALAELGVRATGVKLRSVQPANATVMVARDKDGPLEVHVLGRDEADAQLFAKSWRFIAYKDGGAKLRLTRLDDMEHAAYMLLLAARAGVQVPEVVVAGTAGPGAALLVVRPLDGPVMSDVDAKKVTATTLTKLWREVGLLHGAHVSHGALNTDHVVLAAKGPGINGFASATETSTDERRGADVAELLVTSAAIVGSDRAIAAAVKGVGKEGVVEALPMLQPAALSRELEPRNRHGRKEYKNRLADLRAAAATATGVEEPPLQQLYRVNTTSLLMAVGTLIAVFALLSQIGDPEEFYNTIKDADFAWLAVALVISFLTNFATAVSLSGTVPINLPLMRTAELQLSMSFSNLAVPAVGGMAAQIRFLQKQGVDLASAVASGGLLANVGNIAAQALLLVFAVMLSPTTFHTGKIPASSIEALVLIVAVVGVLAVALIWGVPRIRRVVMPPVKSAANTMWQALRSPRRVVQLFGGNIVNALMYALVLDACLVAFGGTLDFWTLLSLNIFIGTIASLVPIPGGGTAVSSVGMSGALTAVGVPTEIAVATVLAQQLVANFIPAVPGWFATNNLLHDGYL